MTDHPEVRRDADALDRKAQDIYSATNKTHLLKFCQEVVKACAVQRHLLAELGQAERRIAELDAIRREAQEQAERVAEAALQVLDNTTSDEVHKETRRALVEALIVYEQSQGNTE